MDREEFFELDTNGGYGIRGHDLKLKVHRSDCSQDGFFSRSVVNIWNVLPASVVEVPAVKDRMTGASRTFSYKLQVYKL